DGVFNHVGRTFWAFEDLVANQEKSKYKNWFTVKSFDNPNTPENEFDYEGWYGAMDLPEILEDENGLIEAASNHVHDVVKRWMDPNQDGDPSDGIDGWRLDVAEMVKHEFWKKFRTWVKDINPDAYITGEIWWDDWNNNKMMNADPWLKGDQFDAVMNYRFTRAVKHFISDKSTRISASAFADSINNIRKDYNLENTYALMNLLGSHDAERLASMIVNPDHWYDHGAVPSQRESFDVRKPNAEEIQLQKIMVGIQMTMPGAPMIYYGDEAGMWGGDDPDCRKPMVWADKVYETETTHPFGKKRPADDVLFNLDLFNWYKQFIEIRMNNEVLRIGSLDFIESGDDDILIYKRTLDENSIAVIINNSNMIKEITKEKLGNKSRNLISNIDLNNSDKVLKLNPFEIAIYE
ncbi:MAG: alpha-amylase family glycosyl hydrolase, partial [Melioribacteraceae bacterium]|nr:alpha-amylase family glycosyl hydrolase [Melioribacteraceae bacterium]